MQRFKVNNPDQEAYYEADNYEPHLYDIGTHITFQMIGNRIKAAISIPVVFG